MATLKSLLPRVEIVSFDLFDTLISRRCESPEDSFLILEQRLINKFGKNFTGFANARKSIDSECRKLAWEEFKKEEISLEYIYKLLLETHPEWKANVEELLIEELTVERNLLYPLAETRAYFDTVRKAGKRIIITSDMYLPKEFCSSILSDFKLDDFDDFFLSSEIGYLKHSGNLFDYVIKTLGIEPSKILHIGDNPHSDIEKAKERGIQTLKVEKPSEFYSHSSNNYYWEPLLDLNTPPLEKSLINGLSIKNFQESRNESEVSIGFNTGYQIGGPLVYGYLNHILSSLKSLKTNSIYFLARDGDILKRAYEKIRKIRPELPRPKYLYASRRALNFASITKLDDESIRWLSEGVGLRVEDFLNRINLDSNSVSKEIKDVGFHSAKDLVVGGHHYEWLKCLYKRIEPKIISRAKVERENLLQYLKNEGITDEENLILVDVGWRTSIQHSFSNLLKPFSPNLSVIGFYLGTYGSAIDRRSETNTHLNYLMQYGKPKEAFETIRHSVCLLEFFFASEEKTFLFIEKDNNHLKPIFADSHENEKDLPLLRKIHCGILAYLDDALCMDPNLEIQISSKNCLKIINRLLANPTQDEARKLGEVHYADGYGSVFNHSYFAKPSGFKKLGFNKKSWKREFKACHWPKGYYNALTKLDRLIFKWFHPNPRFIKSEH